MEHTVSFDSPAEEVYAQYTERDYWLALMDSYRHLTPQAELTMFRSDERGTDVTFTQTLPRELLPPIAQAVMPVDLVVTREQHFEPFDAATHRTTGEYTATVAHGPGRFGGRYVLRDTDTGSEVELSSVCKVYLPLVGGKLEELILHHMKELFMSEEAFTADWIAEHR